MRFWIFALLFGIFPFLVRAVSPLDIVINEVAWMGQSTSAKNEWIELYNNREKEIDISGWSIENAGINRKTLKISKGKVPGNEFFLICRKKMPDCDFIAKDLSLANDYLKNGPLILKDKAGNIIDKMPDAKSKKWPAGSVKTKQTMARKNPKDKGNLVSNWLTSQRSGGTPKAKNLFVSPKIKNQEGQGFKGKNPKNQNYSSKKASPDTMLIAFSLAVFSGTGSLLLKRKIKETS
ncbi:MAG TPA: lamin tail domain-containing protein [bacterium]|nr:lamin tail domain-containing protein [bacterium]